MRKIFFITRLSLLFFIVLLAVGCNTNEEPVVQKASSITYLIDKIEVGLGDGAISSIPTVVGASPFTFSISNITSTDDNYLLDPGGISIDLSTGVISLNTNNELPVGIYVLDVAVTNKGGTATFTGVLTINIIANIPDVVGKWQLTSATLVDGNAATAEANVLVIANLDLVGMADAPIPVGDVARTTTLVASSLAGFACDIPASYATSFLELRVDDRLLFHCPDEDFIVDDELNIWIVVEDLDNPGTYYLVLKVVVAGAALPITFADIVISADGLTMTGRALGYPMVTDITLPLAVDNIQFISIDMVFRIVP